LVTFDIILLKTSDIRKEETDSLQIAESKITMTKSTVNQKNMEDSKDVTKRLEAFCKSAI